MLRELHILQFALIDEMTVAFEPGLNVISGATGAGKTLISSALGVALGEKISPAQIRKGAEEAVVTALFDLAPDTARAVAAVSDVDVRDELLIRRTLSAAGRARATLNGKITSAPVLQEIGKLLVEFQSQRGHLSLLDPGEQTRALDAYAGLTSQSRELAERAANARALLLRADDLRTHRDAHMERADFLRFQISEIEKNVREKGEAARLEERKAVLDHQEELRRTLDEGYQKIYESEGSLLDCLGDLSARVADLSASVPALGALHDGLENAAAQLKESALAMRDFLSRADFDAGDKNEIDARVDQIRALESKYRRTADELLDHADRLRSELKTVCVNDDDLKKLDAEIHDAVLDVKTRAEKLHRERIRHGKKLAAELQDDLADLGMEKARVEIAASATGGKIESPSAKVDALAAQTVEIRLAPNPGEGMRPLSNAASGGELSRVVIALKARLAESGGIPTLLFDEIDSNVGGRMGVAVGKKLKAVARGRQALCVTHLPQIAAFAAHHVKVDKAVVDGRTLTVAKTLNREERLREIAEMLHGDHASPKAIAQAREMLALAGEKS